jgi:hypothetical protein
VSATAPVAEKKKAVRRKKQSLFIPSPQSALSSAVKASRSPISLVSEQSARRSQRQTVPPKMAHTTFCVSWEDIRSPVKPQDLTKVNAKKRRFASTTRNLAVSLRRTVAWMFSVRRGRSRGLAAAEDCVDQVHLPVRVVLGNVDAEKTSKHLLAPRSCIPARAVFRAATELSNPAAFGFSRLWRYSGCRFGFPRFEIE